MNPAISIVIPLYNRPELIAQVVESVLSQSLPVLEIILVDDGSIDNVDGEIRRILAEKPAWRDRVKFFRQENQGQSVALNNGIARAQGDWIAFNANDDLWLPQKLELQFKAIEKFGDACGLCFTDAWFMNNFPMKGITLFEFAEASFFRDVLGKVDDPVRLLVRHNPVWCQTVVARADLIRRIGGYDPLLRFSEDYDFVFRMALLTKFCYVGLPLALIDRTISPTRHSGASLNWQNKEFKLRMDGIRLEKQLKSTADLEPEVRKAARANMRAHFSKWTNWHLKTGNYPKARDAISAAAKYDLTPGIALKWALIRLSPRLAAYITGKREQSDPTREFGLNW